MVSSMYLINNILRKYRSVIKFRQFGAMKIQFQKIGWSRPEKTKLEKGWFGRKQRKITLRVGRKQGVGEPFGLPLCHFLELSRLSYFI